MPVYDQWDASAPQLAPGWVINAGRLVGRQSGWLNKFCPGDSNFRWEYTLTRLTFVAPDGTEYELRDKLNEGKPLETSGSCVGASRGTEFITADGSAATFYSNNPITDYVGLSDQPGILGDASQLIFPSGKLLLRDGTRFKIVNGLVLEQQDRNGNIVRFKYDQNSSRLIEVTDTLGRKITIEYNVAENILVRVKVNGVGGAQRTIIVERARLNNVRRGDQALLRENQLFPTPKYNASTAFFDPTVVSSIVLPSGHTWNFRYNSYGEIAYIKTPANGVIQYDAEEGQGPYPPGADTDRQIFRRVKERRTYADGNILEGRVTYSDPSLKTSGTPNPVMERFFNGNGTVLSEVRHKFNGSPLDNYGKSYGVSFNTPRGLIFTDYKPWKEGREVETVAIDNGVDKRKVNSTFEQRALVSWSASNINDANQPENDTRLTRTKTTLLDTSQVSEVEYQYDLYNNVTVERVYDFGAAGTNQRGVQIRDIERTYLSVHNGVNYQTNADVHMRSLITSEIIKKDLSIPPQNAETRTEYEYDIYSGGLNSSLLDRPFAFGDTSRASGYGTDRILRGNLTKVNNGANGSQPVPAHYHYDIAGNVVKILGPLAGSVNSLHSQIIDYASEFNFAYPTSTTQQVTKSDGSGTLTLTSSQDYDLHTGLLKSSTGFNPGETTIYQYNDLLDRLTAEIRPTGFGRTDYFYSPPTTYPSWVRTETRLDATRNIVATSYFDGLLKSIKSERNDAGSGGIVYSETRYDGLGRAFLVSNPRRTIVADTDGWTRTKFDGLGRVVSVASYNNDTQTNCSAPGCTGEVTTFYQGTAVTVTDQALKQRRSSSDALGRLIEVREPDAGGGLSLATNYEYDARGNLKTVIQGTQVRTFVYDALSRLTSATAPESGTTSYTYDAASNLLTRTDARGTTIGRVHYSYDELNRIRTKSYLDSTVNANAAYYYDDSTVPSIPAGFSRGSALGRLVAVISDPVAQTGQGQLGYFYGYELLGRVARTAQLMDGIAYQSTISYNELSLPISETYPSGTVITTSYNNAGQISTVSRNGQVISSNASYSATGSLGQEQLGNQLYHTISYNNRLQPKQISLGTTINGTERLSLGYDYGLWMESSGPDGTLDQSKNNGNIGRITITPGAGTTPIKQNFSYDELNRIKLAREYYNGVASWSQSFVYDRYGNRSCCTPALGTGTGTGIQISQTNNRIIDAGFNYDLAGNLINEPTLSKAYNYDAENRLIKASQQGAEVGKYYYDGNGQRVKAITAQGSRSMVYDASGRLIAEYTTNTAANAPSKEYVYRGGELISVVEATPPEMPPNITALTPNSGVQATSFSLKIDGSNLANAQEIIFTPNTGITVSGLTSTANSVTATITIAADAPPETRNVQVRTNNTSNGLSFSVTTPGGGQPPNAPTNLRLQSPATATEIKLLWDHVTSGETNFILERATNGGSFNESWTLPATPKSYTDTNIAAITNYRYRVKAKNANGVFSAYSNELVVNTPGGNVPAAPSGLMASAVTATQVTLTWIDESDNETSFAIDRSPNVTPRNFTPIGSVFTPTQTYTDSNLQPNTVYYYQVRALNGAISSAASAEVMVQTLSGQKPPIPTNLTATAIGATTINLSWQHNSPDETGFSVERANGVGQPFNVVATLPANTLTHQDTGLTASTTYYYRVKALNSTYGDSDYSVTASATTSNGTGPAAPVVTSVTATDAVSPMVVNWTHDGNNVGSFLLFRQLDSDGFCGGFVVVGSLPATARSYSDTAVAAGRRYSYKLRALAPVTLSSSPDSNIMAATKPGPAPIAPAIIKLTVVSQQTIDIQWQDKSNNESTIVFERGIGANPTSFTTVKTVCGNNAVNATFTDRDNGVSGQNTYAYRIGVKNSANPSYVYSPLMSVTVLPPPSWSGSANLKATSATANQVALSWLDASNETSYQLERALGTGPNISFSVVASMAANAISYTDRNAVQANTTYQYRVRAVNSSGQALSNTITVTTPPGRPPIRATALSVTASSATQTELSWIDNSDEENGYIVERSDAGSAYQVVTTLAENSTSYTDNGVRASSKYSYRVKAYNDAGESDYSEPSSITLPNESGQFAATITIKYIVANHLGTPAIITDSNGAVISRHDYYPFGEEIELNLSGRTAALGYNVNDGIRQRYTAYERDEETGLDFAQARYYGSMFGRFLSPDPLSGTVVNPQTWNRYAYVLNNPLKFVDPTGTFERPRMSSTGERESAEKDYVNRIGGAVRGVFDFFFGGYYENPGDAGSQGLQGLRDPLELIVNPGTVGAASEVGVADTNLVISIISGGNPASLGVPADLRLVVTPTVFDEVLKATQTTPAELTQVLDDFGIDRAFPDRVKLTAAVDQVVTVYPKGGLSPKAEKLVNQLNDLQILAEAKALGLPLLTNNLRDFNVAVKGTSVLNEVIGVRVIRTELYNVKKPGPRLVDIVKALIRRGTP
ncbi:MAG: fibronectin type III domain-containing protein [Acidobacteriota bacterium]